MKVLKRNRTQSPCGWDKERVDRQGCCPPRRGEWIFQSYSSGTLHPQDSREEQVHPPQGSMVPSPQLPFQEWSGLGVGAQ